ncbi:MAG: MBOAT family O-acyltransferase [Planctomycetota bacterium]
MVFLGNFALARHGRVRKGFLLAASYYFYAQWDPRFLILIWISTAVDWFVGIGLGRSEDRRHRKILLGISLGVNLSLLGTFKYLDFFIESTAALIEALGMHADLHTLGLILPVGISFYTFQTLSYTIDIYLRKLKPHDSPLDFALFVSFFPQLVAGPIVRARNFLPQLAVLRLPNRDDLSFGVYSICSGLFKKVILADLIGASLAAPFYSNPDEYGMLGAIAGIYGFAFQLFGDFAGYSQIAIGCGALLGFRLPQNFDNPFMARNNLEIWRRWHITLLTWLRDYVYIPLGGSRGSNAQTYRNILITNFVSGVWHGAGINYVLWGLVNGLTICFSRFHQGLRKVAGKTTEPGDPLTTIWVQRFLTFHLWLLAMPIFRTQSLDQLGEVGKALIRWEAPVAERQWLPVLGAVLLAIAFLQTITSEYQGERIRNTWARLSPELQGGIFLIFLGLLGAFAPTASPFLYFQF